MIIIDGSIGAMIIFSHVEEGLKFIGVILMFIISASIIILGAYYFTK
jgi:hypothetical protein